MEAMAKRIVSGVNNINDFPDEILSHIISFLHTRAGVRTSILSRRWRDLYPLLPNLDLDVSMHYEKNPWLKFVDRFVFKRDIPTIQSFRLNCAGSVDPERVGIWICALVWHKIKELDFRAICPLFDDSSLAQSLFCCESLVVLRLDLGWECHELKVLDKISLPRLEVLHLEYIGFANDGSDERLFSSCPALEELVLNACGFSEGWVKFSISNRNLKRLTLEHIKTEGEMPVDILIDAPSLILLKYNIKSECSLVFVDAKSPAEVVIDWYENNVCIADDVIHIANLLRQIQNIKTLEVDNDMLLDLEYFNVPIPFYDKITSLKIRGFRLSPISFEYFLARCVVLEALVVECTRDKSDLDNQYSLQKSQLAPLLCHLRTIEITLIDMVQAEGFMQVIAFFLENAMVLEEVKICCVQSSDPAQQVEIRRKLMSFPRASNKCRLLV